MWATGKITLSAFALTAAARHAYPRLTQTRCTALAVPSYQLTIGIKRNCIYFPFGGCSDGRGIDCAILSPPQRWTRKMRNGTCTSKIFTCQATGYIPKEATVRKRTNLGELQFMSVHHTALFCAAIRCTRHLSSRVDILSRRKTHQNEETSLRDKKKGPKVRQLLPHWNLRAGLRHYMSTQMGSHDRLESISGD